MFNNMQADREPRDDDGVIHSEDEGADPSDLRRESDEEGEDLMDNLEA